MVKFFHRQYFNSLCIRKLASTTNQRLNESLPPDQTGDYWGQGENYVFKHRYSEV